MPRESKLLYKFRLYLDIGLLHSFCSAQNAKTSQEMLRLMVKEPNVSPDELEQMAVSTLVIAGRQDMIKENHTELIAKSIPNSELVLIKGDHFIANKESAVFNEK